MNSYCTPQLSMYTRSLWQGNVRAVVHEGAGRAAILDQTTYYYPYGMPMAESTTPEANRYKYTAKELFTDSRLNLADHGARMYDPAIGRWISQDPMQPIFYDATSYMFAKNNPIRYVDRNGLFNTEAEANKYVNKYFRGAQVLQDKVTGEWFATLNAEGNAPYVSGGTLTRDFGYPNPFQAMATLELFQRLNKGFGALGTSLGIKEAIIELAAKDALKNTPDAGLKSTEAVDKAMGKTIGEYAKITQNIGNAVAVVSIGSSLYTFHYYYKNGGNDWTVGAKCALDITMTCVGVACGPGGAFVSGAYFLVDTACGGLFGNPELPKNAVTIDDNSIESE